MSTGRSDTSSKRKRSRPQKFKNRKLFASSKHDIVEQPESSQATDGEAQEDQLSLSKLPVTLQNKENMPDQCPNGSMTASRGRGRPKGSKNKTFPTLPTKVYAVREGKAPVYTSKPASDSHSDSPNRGATPHRGRGRPKGTSKVKPVDEDVPKRSRGRPKGSKNRKPSKAYNKMLASGEKIGRGRPQKIPHDNVALTPKRGRGRPKGSPNKVTALKRLSMSVTPDGKKRGRPKKIMLHHPALLSSTPKLPRGRPKKEGSFAAVPSHDHKLTLMSETFQARKRGRPKKTELRHSALMLLSSEKPREKPVKKESFLARPSHDHEVRSSDSNSEDEDNMDSGEEKDNNDEDDQDDDDYDDDDDDK